MVKKIPMRSCVLTREQLPKQELIRIVRTPEKEVVVDLKGKTNGRGAYLKLDIEIIKKAQKIKLLDKKLEVEVKEEIYEKLLKIAGDKIA